MKISLLLLWSLINTSLQTPSVGANCNCAAGAGSSLNGSNSGFSDGYGALNSPCMDCRGRGRRGGGDCYGDGGAGGGSGNGGGCSRCCRDSTCDMYQHYPYQPVNHGYYYFHPYNYTHVWKHQQWVTTIGGDPRNPYSRAVFIPIYEQFENTTYEPDHKPSSTLSTLPTIMKQLPDLEKLIKGATDEAPEPTPAEAPPPANENK